MRKHTISRNVSCKFSFRNIGENSDTDACGEPLAPGVPALVMSRDDKFVSHAVNRDVPPVAHA